MTIHGFVPLSLRFYLLLLIIIRNYSDYINNLEVGIDMLGTRP